MVMRVVNVIDDQNMVLQNDVQVPKRPIFALYQ